MKTNIPLETSPWELFGIFLEMVRLHLLSATPEQLERVDKIIDKVMETTKTAKRGDLLIMTAILAQSLAQDFLDNRQLFEHINEMDGNVN